MVCVCVGGGGEGDILDRLELIICIKNSRNQFLIAIHNKLIYF